MKTARETAWMVLLTALTVAGFFAGWRLHVKEAERHQLAVEQFQLMFEELSAGYGLWSREKAEVLRRIEALERADK